MKTLIILIFIMMSCSSNKTTLTNRNDIYYIDFEINGKKMDFYQNVGMMIFDQEGGLSYAAKFINGVYFPDIQEDKIYDLCFEYRSHKVCFDSVNIADASNKWYFTIDETPKDNHLTIDTNVKGTGYYLSRVTKGGNIVKSNSKFIE